MFFDLSLIKAVQMHGLTDGCRKVLSLIGIDCKHAGTLPQSGPVLIISNHNGMPDTLLIFATVTRSDLYHVALSTYKDILMKSGLEEHNRFIPIYRNVSYRDFIPKLIWGDSYQYLQRNKHKARDLNTKSISQAVDILEEGNMVVIFPQGSVGRPVTKTKWKAGIGYLIKQIRRDDIQIVFVSINGTAKTDIFRFVQLIRPLFRNKDVSIQFSKPFTLSDLKIDTSKQGREIAIDIERAYYNVVKPSM